MLASGISRISHVQMDNHDITNLYHLNQCGGLAHFEIFRGSVGNASRLVSIYPKNIDGT